MSISPFDSEIFGPLFGDPFVEHLFRDAEVIRAMLMVEAHLAKVEGELGVIPLETGIGIFEALQDAEISPVSLAHGTAQSGIPVPALVGEARRILGPELGRFVHWGATSQDIQDTGLILRLSQLVDHLEVQLRELLGALADLALEYRSMPIAARTRSQMATPTSLGAKIAVWGSPMLRHLERLDQMRPRLLQVSFAGASGNLSALGDDGMRVADALADSLGLQRQALPWHSARDSMAEFGSLLGLISGSLGKIADDLLFLGQTDVRELRAGSGGGSSTMPHKSNPVGAETIVTLSGIAANATQLMQSAMVHSQERDGVAWAREWHALPQAAMATAGSLRITIELMGSLKPDPARMLANMEATHGLIFAEAATFALAQSIPRAKAQALIKVACAEIDGTNHLCDIMQARHAKAANWEDVFDAAQNLGAAPQIADHFAELAKAAIKSDS